MFKSRQEFEEALTKTVVIETKQIIEILVKARRFIGQKQLAALNRIADRIQHKPQGPSPMQAAAERADNRIIAGYTGESQPLPYGGLSFDVHNMTFKDHGDGYRPDRVNFKIHHYNPDTKDTRHVANVSMDYASFKDKASPNWTHDVELIGADHLTKDYADAYKSAVTKNLRDYVNSPGWKHVKKQLIDARRGDDAKRLSLIQPTTVNPKTERMQIPNPELADPAVNVENVEAKREKHFYGDGRAERLDNLKSSSEASKDAEERERAMAKQKRQAKNAHNYMKFKAKAKAMGILHDRYDDSKDYGSLLAQLDDPSSGK